jgi:hypothetical protein
MPITDVNNQKQNRTGSMVRETLRTVFEKFRTTPPLPRSQGGVAYDCYKVEDPALAESLRAWQTENARAHAGIDPFLIRHFINPQLRVDDDGRITEVLHNNKFLHIPDGWLRRPATLWVFPASEAAKRDVEALPRLPSRQALHRQINWPTITYGGESDEERTLVDRCNDLVHVRILRDSVYVAVPCKTYLKVAFPAHAGRFSGWQPPHGLTPYPYEEVEDLYQTCRDLAAGRIWPPVRVPQTRP